MKKINDWENIEASGDYKNVTPGGYIAIISGIKDVANKEYLEVYLDILQGEFKGYYKELYERKGFWGLKAYASYKEKALGLFKRFITSVEESNKNFTYDFDENKLKNKAVGIVLSEEEYKKNDGTVSTRLVVNKFYNVEAIKHNDFKVPELKKLDTGTNTPVEEKRPVFVDISEDDIEF